MNSVPTFLLYMLTLLMLAGCGRESRNPEHDNSQENTLIISRAWARPVAEGSNSAAYMTIHNHTSRPDTLIAVSSEAAAMAQVHETYEKEGMAGMRPAGKPVIPSGKRMELKPGGLHIMLMQVKRQLIKGDSLQLNLRFANAGTKEIAVVVQ